MIPQPSTVDIGDGLTVGVYEFGEPAGEPVIAFHGVPACGAGFVFVDEPARHRRLRVVAPDRPGVGLSSSLSGWTVGSYPRIVTALADRLGFDRFGVWGWSGGGPFAVAVAASDPARVSRLAVTAGMGEVGVWARVEDFERTDRQMLAMARARPRLARLIMGATARFARVSPTSAAKSFAKQLSVSDRTVIQGLGTPADAMAMFTQAFLGGARGVVDDYRAIAQPWGVDFDDITAPTTIFQGDADPVVPAAHAHGLAERIRGADLVIWSGEGHLALVTHCDEVLDWLVPGPSPRVTGS